MDAFDLVDLTVNLPNGKTGKLKDLLVIFGRNHPSGKPLFYESPDFTTGNGKSDFEIMTPSNVVLRGTYEK